MRENKIVIATLIIISVFNLSCGEKYSSPQEITLKETLAIGGINSDILFQWVCISEDEKNNLFVTDGLECTVNKFDSSGKLLQKAGRKGQGPGEFIAPRLIASSRTHLFITDQGKTGIQIFDHDLVYQGHINYPFPIYDIKILPDGFIAIYSPEAGLTSKIIELDQKGNVHKEIILDKTSEYTFMNHINFEVDKDGYYYCIYNFKDRIDKLDKNGNMIWSRKILNVEDLLPEEKFGIKMPTRFLYKDIKLDQNGSIYVLGGSFSKNQSRDVYILDRNGILVKTAVLPETSHSIFITRNGKLLSRADEGLTIKIFSIENN